MPSLYSSREVEDPFGGGSCAGQVQRSQKEFQVASGRTRPPSVSEELAVLRSQVLAHWTLIVDFKSLCALLSYFQEPHAVLSFLFLKKSTKM